MTAVHGDRERGGASGRRPQPKIKRRNALYYWRLLRQLPWLPLRYKL
jgi:hypothetical protein